MGIAADLVLIVVAGLVGGVVAHRLGQPLLVGYILAGVAVGPHTAGPTVVEVHDIELLAEIGVALLLFALGLELRFRDLAPVRRLALVGGPIQILVTGALGYAFAEAVLGWPRIPAAWMGAMVSLSSTMVVLKVLAGEGLTTSLAGRAMIGMLIVQDLAVAPMLIGLPRLGEIAGALPELAWTLAQAALFLVAMVLVGTRLMPRLLRRLVRWRSRELFLVTIVAIGVGVGYGTYLFGLTFAFGSFVAGMVMSESDFSHQALSDIVPLRDVFGLLFFASAGMLLDPRYLVEHPALVAATVGIVVVVKSVVCGGLARVFGYRGATPWIVGLGLAQVGEFSFVLARTGLAQGALSSDQYGLALTASLATMVLSPALVKVAGPLHRRFGASEPEAALRAIDLPAGGLADHVVVVGYGRTGQAAVEVMRGVDVPFAIVEHDPALAEAARRLGLAVVWGDASRPEVLAAAGLGRSRLLLLTQSDPTSVRLAVENARRGNPALHVIARAARPEELLELARRGVHEAVQPEFEAGLEMVRQVLVHYDTPPGEVQRFTEAVRADLYGPMQEGGVTTRHRELLDEIGRVRGTVGIDWSRIPKGSPIDGATIGSLGIRDRTGATVVAIARGRTVDANPGPASRLAGGDRVALLGTAEHRARGQQLLEGGGG